ncbi:hypothetical protein NP493_3862g00005, partial [Ridgeia piscesae]
MYLLDASIQSFRRVNGYLLTQMPLPDTAVDFWHLVYDPKCPTIITLLEVNSQRTYWPGEEVSMKSYGKLTVTRLSEPTSTMEDVGERDFSVCITTKSTPRPWYIWLYSSTHRDGASRSGLFCAASHLLGSLTVDQYVDVFHSAQHVRNKWPQAIDSLVC